MSCSFAAPFATCVLRHEMETGCLEVNGWHASCSAATCKRHLETGGLNPTPGDPPGPAGTFDAWRGGGLEFSPGTRPNTSPHRVRPLQAATERLRIAHDHQRCCEKIWADLTERREKHQLHRVLLISDFGPSNVQRSIHGHKEDNPDSVDLCLKSPDAAPEQWAVGGRDWTHSSINHAIGQLVVFSCSMFCRHDSNPFPFPTQPLLLLASLSVIADRVTCDAVSPMRS
jgi:hypothetical protein